MEEGAAGERASYRDDERLVVLKAAGTAGAYDFPVRLDADPATGGVTLDDTIRDCTLLRPVSVFVDKGHAAISDEPFLVLSVGGMDSSNRLTASERALNGTSVVMCRNGDYGSSKYDRYDNLTGTVLRSGDPMRNLSHLRVRLLASDGTALAAPSPPSSLLLPRFVFRAYTRIGQHAR